MPCPARRGAGEQRVEIGIRPVGLRVAEPVGAGDVEERGVEPDRRHGEQRLAAGKRNEAVACDMGVRADHKGYRRPAERVGKVVLAFARVGVELRAPVHEGGDRRRGVEGGGTHGAMVITTGPMQAMAGAHLRRQCASFWRNEGNTDATMRCDAMRCAAAFCLAKLLR